MPVSERISKLAAQWLEWDRNELNASEIRILLKEGNEQELEKRLGARIAFGTAGTC